MTKMHFIEFAESDFPKANTTEGIFHDVLILGANSPTHRRKYAPEAMRKAIHLYENQRVYIDHPSEIDRGRKGRSAADRFGSLVNVRFVEQNGGQVRGDLVYLKTHPLSPRVAEDQERNLRLFGLSHLADGSGRIETHKGQTMSLVESIDSVAEVDLVTNPGTAMSLREQGEDTAEPATSAEPANPDAAADDSLLHAIQVILSNTEWSTEEKEEKIIKIVGTHLEIHGEEEEEEAEAEAETEAEAKTEPKEEPAATEEEKKMTEQAATNLSATISEQIAAAVKPLQEQIAALSKKPRKQLPPVSASPPATPMALAEQASSFPVNGTPAEKQRWLMGR